MKKRDVGNVFINDFVQKEHKKEQPLDEKE
jgi:hypothetical protein